MPSQLLKDKLRDKIRNSVAKKAETEHIKAQRSHARAQEQLKRNDDAKYEQDYSRNHVYVPSPQEKQMKALEDHIVRTLQLEHSRDRTMARQDAMMQRATIAKLKDIEDGIVNALKSELGTTRLALQNMPDRTVVSLATEGVPQGYRTPPPREEEQEITSEWFTGKPPATAMKSIKDKNIPTYVSPYTKTKIMEAKANNDKSAFEVALEQLQKEMIHHVEEELTNEPTSPSKMTTGELYNAFQSLPDEFVEGMYSKSGLPFKNLGTSSLAKKEYRLQAEEAIRRWREQDAPKSEPARPPVTPAKPVPTPKTPAERAKLEEELRSLEAEQRRSEAKPKSVKFGETPPPVYGRTGKVDKRTKEYKDWATRHPSKK